MACLPSQLRSPLGMPSNAWRTRPFSARTTMTISRTVRQQSHQPTAIRFSLRPLAAALALSQFVVPGLALADGVVHIVNTCDDALVLPVCNGIDDGTLRQAFACAQNGDTVDLTNLQCSTITLSAPLTSGPVGLTVNGPGPESLTISAGNQFRANRKPANGCRVERPVCTCRARHPESGTRRAPRPAADASA